ncbi:MAG TPA: 2-dehydropantoate 2-reductase [Allosphingosinicella sp.]|jgi:2-dehydropantoate 2-reductase|nr:2-dehydropantoate 2-reductase [Allosphingosinicella sp.]
MTRVAVVGPGGIGGTVAAWLARNSALDVSICARTPFETLRLDAPGGTIEAALPVLTDPAEAAPVDWVLVATKTYDVEGAAAWLARLARPDTRVAILQNGVEHVEHFAPFVPAGRLLPAVVNIPAERSAPGRILQRRNGAITVPAGADGDAFVRLFAGAPIALSTTGDFLTAAWQKLALNCTGAVNALVLQPNGVVHAPGIADLMRGLIAECIAVGRAEGAKLGDDLAGRIIEGCRTGPADSVNSMHADRLAGRPMEIDARNGVIVRRGARHGIAAPLNAMMVTLLEAASA